MKIALPEVSHLGEDPEIWWNELPKGTREFINNEESGRPIDLKRMLFDFVPQSMEMMVKDKLFMRRCNFPRSMDAAYMIASDMFSKGQIHQSVHMVFFAAIFAEFTIKGGDTMYEVCQKAVRCRTVSILYTSAHLHCAVVNTQTTNLLHNFLSKRVDTHSLSKYTECTSLNDHPLFNGSTRIPTHPDKLITVFFHVGTDYYREFGVYENSSMSELLLAWTSICANAGFPFVDMGLKKLYLSTDMEASEIVKFCSFLIRVNDENEYRKSIYAKAPIREIGVQEGDVISLQVIDINEKWSVKDDDEVTSRTRRPATYQKEKKKKFGMKRKGKSNRKRETPLVPSPKQEQEPTVDMMELKEAHSMQMEDVLNEMRPKFLYIRQKLDSLTLERQSPKQKKAVARCACKENDCNFIDRVSTTGGKAGKTAYPVLVGLVQNLHKSSKGKAARLSKVKVISLDLHGLTKRKALDTLNKSLPQWVDIAMKGTHPFVIPIDIICGGGSQELSEVVATWIRKEMQVANRPKGYFI